MNSGPLSIRKTVGADPDIVVASAKAYLSALNKLHSKAERVAAYCRNMGKEMDMIAHSCGLRHAREFQREHVRMVQPNGESVALNMLYPYPRPA